MWSGGRKRSFEKRGCTRNERERRKYKVVRAWLLDHDGRGKVVRNRSLLEVLLSRLTRRLRCRAAPRSRALAKTLDEPGDERTPKEGCRVSFRLSWLACAPVASAWPDWRSRGSLRDGLSVRVGRKSV